MSRGIYLAASVAIILVIALNWWLGGGPQPTAPDAAPDTRFDYALTDFNARFHDADGGLRLNVSGPRLEHSADTRRARILEPRFEYDPAGTHWTGRSDTGFLEREDNELILVGNVVLIHPHPDDPVRIESDQVHFHRDRQIAHSPGPGRIYRAGTELRGGTLSVWFEEQRMELKNHVQAEFRAPGAGGTHPVDGDG